MTESRVQTSLGFTIIELTKHLMNRFHIDKEAAYRKLLGTEFYSLLNDLDTGLYLETNEYLCKSCDLELEKGKAAMYDFINRE